MKGLKATFCLVGVAAAMLTACSSAPEQTLTVSGLDPAKFDILINLNDDITVAFTQETRSLFGLQLV